MDIAVVGCGSIGVRRARILKENQGHNLYFYDINSFNSESCATHIGGTAIDGPMPVGAVLICTPPGSGRANQIAEWLDFEPRGLYVEKPLALTAEEIDDIAEQTIGLKATVTMGACNLRFTDAADKLSKIAKPWRKLRLTMSQHERFWNPDHEKVTLALDSIHELDLAVHLSGPIRSIRGWSSLDQAEMTVHHTDTRAGVTEILLDRMGDPAVRRADIYTEDTTYRRQIDTPNSMYERELAHFIYHVRTGTPTDNPIWLAAEICHFANEIT